jgi:class 3 adenylate cyclase
MQAFILGRAKERSAEGLPFFEMRLGIHTGPVVAGIVGVKKFQYDIWGDTVNTASRMESAGQVGKVNISESTYAMIKDDPEFVFEHRGRIEAKGKGEMEMWFVGRA